MSDPEYPDYIHKNVIYWYESLEPELADGFKKVIFDPDMEAIWLKVFEAVNPLFNAEKERKWALCNSESSSELVEAFDSVKTRWYLCPEAIDVVDRIAKICKEYSITKDFKNYLVERVPQLTKEIKKLRQAAEKFSDAFDNVFGLHVEHKDCKHESLRLSCKHAHFDDESRESYRPGLLLASNLDSGRGEFKPMTQRIRLLLKELDRERAHEEQMRPTKGNQGYLPSARAMGLELTYYFLDRFNTPMHEITSAFVSRICGITYSAEAVRKYAERHLADEKLMQ